MKRIILLSTFLTLSATAIAQQKPLTPLAGESPTRGVRLPNPAISDADDATAIESNPGALGFLPGWSLTYHHAQLDRHARFDGGGDALFFAAPLPVFESLRFGLGLQWLRPSSAIGYGDSTKFTFALAKQIRDSFSLGFAYHNFYSSDDLALDALSTIDVGLAVHPHERWGLGLAVRDLFAPRYDQMPLQRVYALEFLLRPLATRRLELGLGVNLGERRGTADPSLRLVAEPLAGLQIFGNAELVRRDFLRDSDTLTDARFLVGLSINSEHIGLAFSSILGRELPAATNGPLADNSARSVYQGFGVTLNMRGTAHLPLVPPKRPFVKLEFKDELSQTKLLKTLLQLKEIATRDDLSGIFVEIDGLDGGFAQIQELRDAFALLRSRGKKIVVNLQSASLRDYYLATAADTILLDPAGALRLKGLASDKIYIRALLDKTGILPQYLRIAEYKSAPETFTATTASPAARAMQESIIDDVYARLIDDLAQSRGLSTAQIKQHLDQGNILPPEALSLRLVDKLVERVDLDSTLRQLNIAPLRDFEDVERIEDRWPVGPAVAIIIIDGDIIDGPNVKIPFLKKHLCGDEAIAEALDWARDNDDVKAIILRINSPGGSAQASEHIFAEVLQTQRVKPVVVSMGDYAASGGYFSAVGGGPIFALPSTLTGSIGIFSGKFDFSGLEKLLGLHVESTSRGRHALLDSLHHAFTPDDEKLIMHNLQYTYRRFLAAVAQGRHLTQEQVNQRGRGRVFTGNQARGQNLVDQEGGFLAALDEAHRLAGVPVSRPWRNFFLPEEPTGLLKKVADIVEHEKIDEKNISQIQSWLPPGLYKALEAWLPLLSYARTGQAIARLPYQIVWQ